MHSVAPDEAFRGWLSPNLYEARIYIYLQQTKIKETRQNFLKLISFVRTNALDTTEFIKHTNVKSCNWCYYIDPIKLKRCLKRFGLNLI